MDKELKAYIEKEIRSKYRTFDKGHNVNHFNSVTKNCTKYAKLLNKEGHHVDADIVYVVGVTMILELYMEEKNTPYRLAKLFVKMKR